MIYLVKYQIALLIDDSRSMKPVSELALSSLALIARALTRLEGTVDLASWG